jgi:uncharacterized delta-60 repeat protein
MKNNKSRLLQLAALATLAAATIARADLALDTTFDTDGIATLNFAAGLDGGRDIAEQADGRYVVAGFSLQTVGADTFQYVAVARFNVNGTLDSTFDTDGQLTLLPGGTPSSGGGGEALAVAIQPVDQKIVIAGSWDPNDGSGSKVLVIRLDTSGVLDTTFDTDGIVILTLPGLPNAGAEDLAIQADGSIVVVGGANESPVSKGFVLRLTATGALDATFATGGVYEFDNPAPVAGLDFGFRTVHLLPAPGNGILAAGGGGDFAVVQLTSAGVPDVSFDSDGVLVKNFFSRDRFAGPENSDDDVLDLAVQPDGGIVIGGYFGFLDATPSVSDALLARLTSTGAADTSFGSGGDALFPDAGNNDFGRALALRSSGDFVLAGSGIPPTQVSPGGITFSAFTNPLPVDAVQGLAVLADGSTIVGIGERLITGTDSQFVVVRFTATDLPDGPDSTPDPIIFTTQSNLEPGQIVTSNTVTVTGINTPVVVVASDDDLYSIGCLPGGFTEDAGTLNNGDSVCLRTSAALADNQDEAAVLGVGVYPAIFTIITGDSTPNPFTFIDQADVTASTLITSDPITVTGTTTRTDLQVVNGQFSRNCTGVYPASQFGFVDPGDTVCVRHVASSTPGGSVDTTLILGIDGIGQVSDTFTSTTDSVIDVAPDPFSFTDQANVATSTLIVSAPVTITGIDAPAPISISNGQYSIGCGATFTNATGTISDGQTVCVRHTSAPVGATSVNTVLTIGGVSDTFTSTTLTPDTTPDAFAFADQSNVPLATTIISSSITVVGIDTPAAISVTGGEYSIGCTASYTSTVSTVNAGQTVCVRHTSALLGATQTNTALTIGGVSDTFTSTTIAGDFSPDPFTFVDQPLVNPAIEITSAPVTITGISGPAVVRVTGGTYAVGCTGTYTGSQGAVTSGQTICVRHTSASAGATSVNTTLTVGDRSDTFTSTTRIVDTTPNPFSFAPKTNIGLQQVVLSDPATITGIDGPATVNVVDGAYSIGCGPTPSSGPVSNGDTICVALLSAATDNTTRSTTMTIGGVSAVFTVTTGDTVPAPFSFATQTSVPLSDIRASEAITVTGITAPSAVSVAEGEYSAGCNGSWTNLAGLLQPGQSICVRHVSAGRRDLTVRTTLTIGGITGTFDSTTTSGAPLPGSSSMDWLTIAVGGGLLWRRRRMQRAQR